MSAEVCQVNRILSRQIAIPTIILYGNNNITNEFHIKKEIKKTFLLKIITLRNAFTIHLILLSHCPKVVYHLYLPLKHVNSSFTENNNRKEWLRISK